jgi:hypothetical protein
LITTDVGDSGEVAVLRFGHRRTPWPLRGLPVVDLHGVTDHRRVIVLGSDADLASVLTWLLKQDRLDVEIAHLAGRFGARRARRGVAARVPLIRDETGTAIVGAAEWRPAAPGEPLRGEAVVDDTVLFDGAAEGVRVEPTAAMPGLRAAVLGRGPRRWVSGRAAQLGTPGAVVVRDGEPADRPVRRTTFYRHVEGWMRVH